MVHFATPFLLLLIAHKTMATCDHTFQNCGPGCWNEDDVVLNGGLRICAPVGGGYFSPRNDNGRYFCPRGSFSDQEEAETCSICEPGSISGTAFRSCFLCPPSFYQELPGQSTCKQCVPGYSGQGSNNFWFNIVTNTLFCELTGVAPSSVPSSSPSDVPTLTPTATPSLSPSLEPSTFPSGQPTFHPSHDPSSHPSLSPSRVPSMFPSLEPTDEPSVSPSLKPSTLPSLTPSYRTSLRPSLSPSLTPTTAPSSAPSAAPLPRQGVPVSVYVTTMSFLSLVILAVVWKLGSRRSEDPEEKVDFDEGQFANAVVHTDSKASAFAEVLQVIEIHDATVVNTKKANDGIV